MAILLRRALMTSLNLCVLRRAAAVSSNRLTYSAPSAPTRRGPAPVINFLLETRRSFAKARRQKDEDEDDDNDVRSNSSNSFESANIGPSLKAAAVSQMEAATEALTRDLAKLRTGRASPGMLDHIMVDTQGVKTPLHRMAVVSVLDPKTLAITPYDPNTLKELEKAIVSSPLGINPKPDNQRLIAPIPPLTKEHMQAVCKVVAKASEDVKQSIRRARQKALDTIKKAMPKKEKKESKKDKDKSASAFSVDDAKRLEKEIDDLTKKFIKSAEDMCKAKEKEITGG